jgi:uncharacterized protein
MVNPVSEGRESMPGKERSGERGWALVTGASRGIGRELALELAREGWDVALTARDEEALREVARKVEAGGRTSRIILSDLGTPEGVAALLQALIESGIDVEVLVNNAGIGDYGPFVDADADRMGTMVHLNVTAVTELTRRLLPGMVARGRGRVLNVASTAAFQPGPLMAVYYASKAYVLSLSEAIHDELRGTGVSVTALCPGPTRSDFHARAGMEGSPLANGFPMVSSRRVARAGVRAMLRGKAVALPGLLNRIHVFFVRFIPRSLVPRIVRWVQKVRV